MIQALNDFVLLEKIPKEQPRFVLPNQREEMEYKLRVKSIPADKELPYKVGDVVFVHKHAVLDYKAGEEEIIYIKVHDIVGVEHE